MCTRRVKLGNGLAKIVGRPKGAVAAGTSVELRIEVTASPDFEGAASDVIRVISEHEEITIPITASIMLS